jgi:hypothetical protein
MPALISMENTQTGGLVVVSKKELHAAKTEAALYKVMFFVLVGLVIIFTVSITPALSERESRIKHEVTKALALPLDKNIQ